MILAKDTIYAPSSAAGRAALCVIRISGPDAIAILKDLTGQTVAPDRRLIRVSILSLDGETIDDALVVAFREGASFTGEPMAELHCHGGRAVVSAVCDRLEGIAGCRLAEPGEFARRAYLNERIDLSEAEGLADLIAADTEVQRREAMRLMSGGLTRKAKAWRDQLLRACALVEVTIDWVDEDVPQDVMPEVRGILGDLIEDLGEELVRSERTAKLRAGYEVAIVGAPNAGKSSLLNAIAGRDAAIISEVPGTTRDVVEVRCDIQGLPVTFLDTAGLRETVDHVEKIGVARARERASLADLRLHLESGDTAFPVRYHDLIQRGDLRVWTKDDVETGPGDVRVSAKTGAGIEDLLRLVHRRIGGSSGEPGLLGHRRHQAAVTDAIAVLRECIGLEDRVSSEILASEIRRAVMRLDRLIGRVGVEDILDRVFASFCLGK